MLAISQLQQSGILKGSDNFFPVGMAGVATFAAAQWGDREHELITSEN
jgi:hypothetical protein